MDRFNHVADASSSNINIHIFKTIGRACKVLILPSLDVLGHETLVVFVVCIFLIIDILYELLIGLVLVLAKSIDFKNVCNSKDFFVFGVLLLFDGQLVEKILEAKELLTELLLGPNTNLPVKC